jgi:hypothetical protein
MYANAFVVSRWHAVDAGYFLRHPERHYRLRGLYPSENVSVDEQRRETPPKGSPVLKIIKQLANGQHDEIATEYLDKAAIFAALDSDAAIAVAFALFSAGKDVIDVRQAVVLAQARATKRLQ